MTRYYAVYNPASNRLVVDTNTGQLEVYDDKEQATEAYTTHNMKEHGYTIIPLYVQKTNK